MIKYNYNYSIQNAYNWFLNTIAIEGEESCGNISYSLYDSNGSDPLSIKESYNLEIYMGYCPTASERIFIDIYYDRVTISIYNYYNKGKYINYERSIIEDIVNSEESYFQYSTTYELLPKEEFKYILMIMNKLEID